MRAQSDKSELAERFDLEHGASRVSSRAAALIAWTIVGVSVALMPFRWLLLYLTPPMPYREVLPAFFVLWEVLALTFPVVGAFVASRRPHHPIGWLLCGIGLLNIVGSFAVAYGDYAAVARPGSLPAGEHMAWIADWLGVPILFSIAAFLFLLFPDGHLPREAWEYGTTPAGAPLILPLVHHWKVVGRMLVAPRSPGEAFSSLDKGLLDDLAGQAGAAAHAARLTVDLRHSRQRLVSAREEERRRLRRDLHDGLGPALGGITLRLDAARSSLPENSHRATRELLSELKLQTQEAVSDIRRLVHDLRPPTSTIGAWSPPFGRRRRTMAASNKARQANPVAR